MNTFKTKTTNAVWWSTLEIASRYGAQFIVTAVLARVLAPSDFGLIAMLLIFTSIAAILVDSGLGTALIQRQRPTPDDETTVFAFAFVASLALAGALILLAPMFAQFFHQPELTGLIRFVSSVLIFGGLATVPDALLTIRLNFKARTLSQTVSSVGAGIAGIALAYAGWGVWSLAWQIVLASALRTLMLWIASGWLPRGRFSPSSLKHLGSFSGYMLLSSLLDTLFTRVQSVLVGKLSDTKSLGYFTLAQSAQQAPALFIGGILGRVGLPVFSRIANDRDRLTAALAIALRVTTFVFMPCMIGIALAARPIIELLYGPGWAPAAPILSALALGTSLWPIHVLNLSAITAQGRSDLFFRLEVVKTLVGLTSIAVGSYWGAIGVAWGVTIASALGAYINTRYTHRLLGYGAIAQLRHQIPTMLLTSAAAIVGFLFLHFLPMGTASTILALFGGATTYIGLASLARPQAVIDTLTFVSAIFRREAANQADRTR
ncbi:O-antigen/teichoic acid export membrane protein [Luteibacter rhizovicinus]|uniref:O-antigen/teichoic acid export membrane protein n=1 Tax=Luteibacter rhizovicinus TaxID=242606 RepID=A0A4R3YTB6_9GAMM|nr:lipopolysaccharide biosynthesis protein [Luteibacter rhizovicinus]TCV94958.1 O-antigen/teichoic acid export membrane protein [Luteibacter rhizovicinus]